jgi:hypothetical protein
MASYDEIRNQHTPPPPLTVGQTRDQLSRFAADMAVRVEIPEEPGSRFANDRFTVSGVEQPTVVADGIESQLNQVRPVGRLSPRGACPARRAPAVSSTPGRRRRWG